MSPSDFSSELTRQYGDPRDPQHFAEEVFRRDRRRIRNLSVAIIGLWLLALLLIVGLLLPLWAKIKFVMIHHPELTAATQQIPDASRVITPFDAFRGLAGISTALAIVTTLASLLAAISTVWLVIIVRKNTLDQINAGLAQISAQLKQLQHPPPTS